MLRRFPESGKPGIEEGTRELVVPKLPIYVVAYRVTIDPSDSAMFFQGRTSS